MGYLLPCDGTPVIIVVVVRTLFSGRDGIVMLILRRYVTGMMLLVAGTLALAEYAGAQQPGQAPGQPPALPSNSRVVGRSYAVEGIVVLVLMVGAGAAVCRSSRRS